MVLANSPAARWRGIASWAELYGVLAQGNGLSEVVDVQVAPAAAMHDGMAPFMYTDPESNPALYHDNAAGHDAMLPGTAGIATPMKLSELLERGCVSTDQALYFTEELGHPALEPLLGRVQPLAWMVLPDDAASAAVDMDSAEPVASLWLGGPGITTQCHYDAPLNLFAQLFGQKRFWLWPPSAAWQAHLYPELHPRARKSQVHIASNGRAHANSTVPAPGLEAPMEVSRTRLWVLWVCARAADSVTGLHVRPGCAAQRGCPVYPASLAAPCDVVDVLSGYQRVFSLRGRHGTQRDAVSAAPLRAAVDDGAHDHRVGVAAC